MPGRKIQGHVFPVPELAKYGIEDDGTVFHRDEGRESSSMDRLKRLNVHEVSQLVGKCTFFAFDQLLPGVWMIRFHEEVSDRWNAAHPEAPWDNSWSPWLHAGAAEFLKKHAFGPSREHPQWWGAWGAREEQAAASICESDRVWIVISARSGPRWHEFVKQTWTGQPKEAWPADFARVVILGPVAAAFLKS
jgi:hypothetical protein